MPKSKLAGLKQQLRAAEEDVQIKTQQLDELRVQVAEARSKIESLEGEANTNAALEDDVQTLLQHQRETAAAFMDYENRVLALELQGLVDRWRTMDIEELAQQNHDLRGECLRLQQENMQLSRAVAENSLSARRDLAKIESALELTVKEKMREMHDRLRQELYDELDDKTKKMVTEHGYLQDYVRDQAAQAATLDRHCRILQADRTRFKVDSDLATSLSEQQAAQTVILRRQLKQAFQTVETLQRRLAESEARAQAAWDEAVRASSRAAVVAAAAARAGLRGGGGGGDAAAAVMAEVDADSAYGMTGEGAEIAALELQLRHAKQRFERMRLQRDRWRDRSTLYEKACAQLQAALQTLQDQAKLTLPSGVRQDLDAVWCAAKAAEAAVDGGGGAAAAAGGTSSRPSTPCLYSSVSTPHSGAGGDGGGAVGEWDGVTGQRRRLGWSSPSGGVGGGGGGGWPVRGGAAAAGAARARAASARVPGAAGHEGQLPARPRTAAPTGYDGGGAAAAAARRAAEAIRASVVLSPQMPPPQPSPLQPATAVMTPGEEAGGGGDGSGQGPEEPGDGAGETRGSSSPGRVAAMSRLYSSDAEPFKVVPKVQYDQTWWPVMPELRPRSPSRLSVTPTPASNGTLPPPQQQQQSPPRPPPPQQQQQQQHAPLEGPSTSLPSQLGTPAATPTPGIGVGGIIRRHPGSMRPHSAVFEPAAAAAMPRWTLGKSLTGLTSSKEAVEAAVADGAGGPAGGSPQEASPQRQLQPPSPARGPTQSSLSLQRPATAPTLGPEPLLPSPVGTLTDGHRRPVSYAAEAERRSWHSQQSRSQSPEYAAIARATSSSLSTANEQHGGSGVAGGGCAKAHGAADGGAPPLPLSMSGNPGGGLPEVGLSGGALYTVVHKIAGAAGSQGVQYQLNAGGGGGGGGGPSISARAALQSFGSSGGGGGGISPGAVLMSKTSAVLAALRHPPTSATRLHNPDVMFSGVRAASARSGPKWTQQGSQGHGPAGGGGGPGGGRSYAPSGVGISNVAASELTR